MRALAFSVMLLLAASIASAQTMAERMQSALAAYQAQDIETATQLVDEVIAEGTDAGKAEPEAYLEALNSRTFLLMSAQEPSAYDAAQTAWDFAQKVEVKGTWAWFTALNNLAQEEASAGNRDAARDARDQMVQGARGTPALAQILPAAIPLAFANEDFTDLRYLVEELIDVTGSYQAPIGLEEFYARQEQAEAEGNVETVTALAYARIAIASSALPDQADQIAHS